VVLSGCDVIAKAKTGTGKTIAFLLPIIERIAAATAPPNSVLALVISPTRELASQIRAECELLISFHKPRLTSFVVVGGTNIKSDLSALRSHPPTVLVATPGRLNDLLHNHGMQPLFHNLYNLVFDEADQLLEMGFRPEVTKMLEALLPSKAHRQTLLFSATLPHNVLEVAKIAAHPTVQLVDTVGEEEQTNTQVEQCAIVTRPDSIPAELLALVRQLTATAGFKLVVFFVTARLTQLFAELFEKLGVAVLEMHSRKSQPHRTRVADQFRDGCDLIMFSSDVSARGMDYPDVTSVIQVGLPSDKAQYIHRLGRTARAGKHGGGFLLLANFEAFFLKDLRDLPIEQRPPLDDLVVDASRPAISAAMRTLPPITTSCAYQAYLGFYNSHLKKLGWSRDECVMRANDFSNSVLGLSSPPPLEAKTIGKMGLKGVPGLVVAPREGRGSNADAGGRGGGGRGAAGSQNGVGGKGKGAGWSRGRSRG